MEIDLPTAGFTTLVLGPVIYLCKLLLDTRLKAEVQLDVDSKLAKLTSELNQREEKLRADLHAKDVQIAALRDGAMAAHISRQTEFDKRRFQAVEQIWTSALSLNGARLASRALSALKLKNLAQRAPQDHRLIDFLKSPIFVYDLKQLRSDAQLARVFASPMAWATFTAFSSVCTHSPMVADAIISGLDVDRFIKTEPMRKLLSTLFPERAAEVASIQDHGQFERFIDPLEVRLVEELRAMVSGKDVDGPRVQQMAEIIALANANWDAMRDRTETSTDGDSPTTR